MSRRDNYLSTLLAIGFIICIPIGLITGILTILLHGILSNSIISGMVLLAYLLIVVGGIFFITHFIFKIIENEDSMAGGSDILDDEI